MKITKYLFLFLIITAGNCHAGWFGPSTYRECLIERLKEAKSNPAAWAIAAECSDDFPPEKPVVAAPPPSPPPPPSLPSEVIDQLVLECHGQLHTRTAESDMLLPDVRSRAEVNRDAPQCSLYNGNNEWTISSLIIRIRQIESGYYNDFNVSLESPLYPGVQPLTMVSQPIYLDLSLFPGEMRTEDMSVFIVSGRGNKK